MLISNTEDKKIVEAYHALKTRKMNEDKVTIKELAAHLQEYIEAGRGDWLATVSLGWDSYGILSKMFAEITHTDGRTQLIIPQYGPYTAECIRDLKL